MFDLWQNIKCTHLFEIALQIRPCGCAVSDERQKVDKGAALRNAMGVPSNIFACGDCDYATVNARTLRHLHLDFIFR
jgi:hypothetical protein